MIVTLTVVSAAWACSCIKPPPTLLFDKEAHTLGPIRVFLKGRWPSDGAERVASLLRVRGPDGASVTVIAEALGLRLDLFPVVPLEPGTYTIEQVESFGDSGVLPLLTPGEGSDVRQRWQTVSELQVVASASTVGIVPRVPWGRNYTSESSSCGPASLIQASVAPVPGARWLDVEVEGLGVIATVPAIDRGFFVYLSDDPCAVRPITLPANEDIRLRAVAVGLDGSRSAGEWSTLGAVGPAHPLVGPIPRLQRFEVPLESPAR